MPTVSDLELAMERIAPTRHAASWDNVGLLVGDRAAKLARVLVCIDLTPAVWAEAVRAGASAIVAYHPPLFDAKKRFLAGDFAFEAARAGIALYSPHTAWDAARGGANDVLADALGLVARRPLRAGPAEADTHHKLVTFVPEGSVEAVAHALAEAGAGRIGDYAHCTFRTRGEGTFLGGESTSPVVGTRGVLERAEEVRLEVVCPVELTRDVVDALFASHPYETPAYDLVRLAPSREKGDHEAGSGLVGDLEPTSIEELVGRAKRALGLAHVLVSGPTEGTVTRAAVGAGATGSLLADVRRAKATFFLLGEMRHHDALDAARHGITVVATLHSNSERASLRPMAAALREALPGCEVAIAETCRDPFSFA
jgi:dinuclear metal center YbgI/SA1388 family protein